MGKKQLKLFGIIAFLLLSMCLPTTYQASGDEDELTVASHSKRTIQLEKYKIPDKIQRFYYDSGLSFEYPDAVRGIYATAHSAGGSRFESLIELIDTTDLNSVVIDVKEDHGYVTFKLEEGHPLEDVGKNYMKDPRAILELLEEKGIYPIARIVVFKDTVLANKRPDLSFTRNGQIWKNGREEAFVSPFKKEVWEYNVEIAKMAAKLGFKDIQFDYVRFPEGFERRDQELSYDQGDYANLELNDVQKRVQAVTDFVAYAKEELKYFDVDVSVDIFGYSATIPEAPGIGQNFSKISSNVDVISSMIYPSHWTPYFGIDFPDKEPYRLVNEYSKVENEVLSKLDNPPVSRPWIQDFEAPWIYTGPNAGPVTQYDVEEIEAQIRALNENGINEFLLWNPVNSYTEGVDYTPLD